MDQVLEKEKREKREKEAKHVRESGDSGAPVLLDPLHPVGHFGAVHLLIERKATNRSIIFVPFVIELHSFNISTYNRWYLLAQGNRQNKEVFSSTNCVAFNHYDKYMFEYKHVT